MKIMKTYRYFGSLLMAGALLVGCSKATDTLKPQNVQKPEAEKTAEESQVTETPEGPNAFILKIEAENAATKALTDLGQTLSSSWEKGDSVSVYNMTTEQAIEGWLYAEADGTSTTFSGTVSGNFNQGDELFLEFLEPQYGIQDGTLEGLAGQSDWAVATVKVTAIDPEAKTISTEQANFEKRQAVVRFNITNRKNPVEPVKVTTFYAYGGIPGGDKFSIKVSPKVASDELYVAIPNYEKMPVTFEAEGEDGFDYRLIVPDVNFEDGLYYRRTLQMKRRALVKAPVAKTELKFNGTAQQLVDAAHVYWISNEQEVILDHEKDYQQDSCVISYFMKKEETAETVPTAPTATENGWLTSVPTQMHAGTYYIWTKMTGNYDYEDADVSDEPVKVVLAKADATLSATAVSTEMTYSGSSQNLLSAGAKLMMGENDITSTKDGDNQAPTIKYYVTTENLSTAPAANDSGWGTSYAAVHAGTHYVWIMTEGNGDINAATAKVSKQIKKATATLSVPVNTNTLTYNGNSQNLLLDAATLKIGSTNVTSAADAQSKACSIQYYLSSSKNATTGGSWSTSYSATNAGTYYVWIKVTGNGDINDIAAACKVGKAIGKKAPTFGLASSSVTFGQSDAVNSTKTVNITYDGDGTLSATSSSTSSATVSVANKVVTITRKSGSAGSATITVSAAEGTNYAAATSQTISVTLTANDGYILKDAAVGYAVASNGLAYKNTSNIPYGSTVIGVVAYKNGNNGLIMQQKWCADKVYYRGEENDIIADNNNHAFGSAKIYVASSTSKNTVYWFVGTKADYQNCGLTDQTGFNNVNNMRLAAGCEDLALRQYVTSNNKVFNGASSMNFWTDGMTSQSYLGALLIRF